MPLFCVIHTDLITGDIFPNGPFDTRETARLWAEAAATEHCLESGATAERDDEPGSSDWISTTDGDDDTHEWSVFTMVQP